MKSKYSILGIGILLSFISFTLNAEDVKTIKANRVIQNEKIGTVSQTTIDKQEEDTLKSKFFAGGNYDISSGPKLSLGYYFHKHFGAELDFGFYINNRRDEYADLGVTKLNNYLFNPSIRLNIPVHYSKWSVLLVSVYSGILIHKPEREDMGIGNRTGIALSDEIFLLKDRATSLRLSGGVEYFTYKSAQEGSGFDTNFGIGFNYYF